MSDVVWSLGIAVAVSIAFGFWRLSHSDRAGLGKRKEPDDGREYRCLIVVAAKLRGLIPMSELKTYTETTLVSIIMNAIMEKDHDLRRLEARCEELEAKGGYVV